MPCYFPLQAVYGSSVHQKTGKRVVHFSKYRQDLFRKGKSLPMSDDAFQIPCGRCMGCRLEKSRQWALRCVNEASCYQDNCFITLTFDPEHLPQDGSLNRKIMQDFIKRLRKKFTDRRIRVFYCGEYGEKLGRPHYHAVLFNIDFDDKVLWKVVNGCSYFTSATLAGLWPFGFSTVGALTFESAAYVARYCTKKVTGELAEDHYKGRLPEFCGMSLKPGIGKPWLDKFGKTDVFPHDSSMARYQKCKPPRYYDILREREDPEGFAKAKQARRMRAESKADDNTYRRLAVKLKCKEAQFKLLIRRMEK